MNSLWVERLVVVFLLLLFFCILCIFHNGRYYFDGYKGKKQNFNDTEIADRGFSSQGLPSKGGCKM